MILYLLSENIKSRLVLPNPTERLERNWIKQKFTSPKICKKIVDNFKENAIIEEHRLWRINTMKKLSTILLAMAFIASASASFAATDFLKDYQAKRDAAIKKQDAKLSEIQKKQAEAKKQQEANKKAIEQKQKAQQDAIKKKQEEYKKQQEANKAALEKKQAEYKKQQEANKAALEKKQAEYKKQQEANKAVMKKRQQERKDAINTLKNSFKF